MDNPLIKLQRMESLNYKVLDVFKKKRKKSVSDNYWKPSIEKKNAIASLSFWALKNKVPEESKPCNKAELLKHWMSRVGFQKVDFHRNYSLPIEGRWSVMETQNIQFG